MKNKFTLIDVYKENFEAVYKLAQKIFSAVWECCLDAFKFIKLTFVLSIFAQILAFFFSIAFIDTYRETVSTPLDFHSIIALSNGELIGTIFIWGLSLCMLFRLYGEGELQKLYIFLMKGIEHIYLLFLKSTTRKLPLTKEEMKKLGIVTLYDWHLWLSKNYTRKLKYLGIVPIKIPQVISKQIALETGYYIQFDNSFCNAELLLEKRSTMVYTYYNDEYAPIVHGVDFKNLYEEINIV